MGKSKQIKIKTEWENKNGEREKETEKGTEKKIKETVETNGYKKVSPNLVNIMSP